ncbi:MAG: flagellar basal body-associated FliL family protein [Bacillota bacterium]
MAKTKPSAEGETPVKAKGGKKLIIIILVTLLILAAGGAAAKVLLFSKKPASDATPAASKGEIQTMELESIVVNLADENSSHYLRITMVLAFSGDEKFVEELEADKYKLRDRIIRILRKKTNAEVTAPDYPDKLKKELLQEVNSQLEGKRISDIYYSEFLVQ